MKCEKCDEQAMEQTSYFKMDDGKTSVSWKCPKGHENYAEYIQ